MIRRLTALASAVALVLSLGVAGVLAGEVTGNGKVLTIDSPTGLHGASLCAYSGQEDLQFFEDEETNLIAKDPATRGDPSHAQSWGQIPKAGRDFLTSIGHNPGIACNPHLSSGQ